MQKESWGELTSGGWGGWGCPPSEKTDASTLFIVFARVKWAAFFQTVTQSAFISDHSEIKVPISQIISQ